MQFLDHRYDTRNIMLLDVYYDRGTWSNPDDILYVLFKEVDTGKKRLEEIIAPDIEVQIIKEEYRDNPAKYDNTYIRDWIPKSMCDVYRVNYKNRNKEISEILGISIEQLMQFPYVTYVYGADIGIERWYIHQFIKEYQSETIPEISAGFFDIETDIINETGDFEYGDVPITCVTYIDAVSKTSYTLIYHHANVLPSNPRYDEMIESYEKSYNYLVTHLDEFDKELHERFDERYGEDFQYIVLTFENELDMIQTFFKIVNSSENDYNAAWNAPFDFGNLIARATALGADTANMIAHEYYQHPLIAFQESTAFNVVKRKHLMFSPNLTVWTDAMVNYAAIRSQQGKLPSNRLNYIAEVELEDSKLDYSEETDIAHFMYDDFWKYIIYNIKDVLLLYAIEEKTRDLLDVTARIAELGVPPRDAFGSLAMEDSAMIMFLDNYDKYTNGEHEGYYVGYNRTKINGAGFELEETSTEDDSDDEYDELFEDEPKEEKYDGAIVLHPGHMTPSGFKIGGVDKKYIHEHIIDDDITAEYPTANIIQNASNETLHGRVVLTGELKMDIPIYENFEFADKDEAAGYKIDPTTFFMEAYQQEQYGIIGKYVLGLPDIGEICAMLEAEGVVNNG